MTSTKKNVCSPRGVPGAKESKPLPSALHEHSKTQTHLRENTVSLASCDDSKLALSSDIGGKNTNPLSSSWHQRTTKQEKRSSTIGIVWDYTVLI